MRVGADARAFLVIATVLIVGNILYLTGVFDPNPLGPATALFGGYTRGVLGGRNFADPNVGYTSQALGHLAARDLLHLRLPWWNPFEGTGVPLAGEMQSAALFPPTLLLIFANGQIYEHVLLELLAGFSTYLLLRRLVVGRVASTAAGAAFALNGTFAWFGHAAANPVAFLPLLLLGLELAYLRTTADRLGGWWLIAVAVALSLYAGFPETAYLDGLFAIAWLAWRCRCAGRARMFAFIRKAAGGGAAGVLIAAPVLVSFVDYLKHANVGAHAGAESVHLTSQAIPQLVLPYVYGSIGEYQDAAGILVKSWGQVGGYLTASLMLFAILGLVSSGRRGLRAILAAWIVLAFARTYGVPVLGAVLGLVPGMASVQFYRFGTPTVELAVVVLAALGLDDLGRKSRGRRPTIVAGLVALGLVIVASIGASGLSDRLHGSGPSTYFVVALLGGAGTVVAGTAAALVRDPRLRVRAACAVVMVEVLAMFVVPQLSAVRAVRTDFRAVTYLQDHIGLGRFFTLGPAAPDYGSYFEVASLNVNDLPLPSNWWQYVHVKLDQYVNPFHFVGTHNGGRPATAPSPQTELTTNLNAYREASVDFVLTSPSVVLGPPFVRVLENPAAWVYELPGAKPFYSISNPACTLRPTDREAVRVSCPTSAALERRETYLPGASAAVDGRQRAVRQTGGLFEAVDVPAGSHLVSFGYTPPGITWGWVAFLLGCAWVVVGLLYPRRRRVRPVVADAPVVGRVEEVRDGVVSGWAWRPSSPERRVDVRVIVDGRDAGTTSADLKRPSLAAAGIGDGRHGFCLALNGSQGAAGGHTLRVVVDGTAHLPAAAGYESGGAYLLEGPAMAGTKLGRHLRVRAVARWLRQRPGLLLATVCASYFTLFVIITRHFGFFADEWAFIIGRQPWTARTFLEPYNQHLELLPILVYKILFATVGLGATWPYRIVAFVLHITAVFGLYALARRRVGTWIALLPAALLLALGAGYSVEIWPVNISFSGSIAAGIWALVCIDRNDRRGDVGASVLMLVSFLCSSAGLPFAVAMAVELALLDRRRLWVVALPTALYALWYLNYGRSDIIWNNAPEVPAYDFEIGSFGFAALLGLSPTTTSLALPVGAIALCVSSGWLVLRRATGHLVSPLTLAGIGGALALWTAAALARAQAHVPESSRYAYTSAAFILIAATGLMRWRRPSIRGLAGVAAALLTIAGLGVLPLLKWANARTYVDARTRATMGAIEMTGRAGNHSYLPIPDLKFLTLFAYHRVVRELGSSPAASPASIAHGPLEFARMADDVLIASEGIGAQPFRDVRRGMRNCPRPSGPTAITVAPGHAIYLVVGGQMPASIWLRRLNPRFAATPTQMLAAGAVYRLMLPTDASGIPWHLLTTAGVCRITENDWLPMSHDRVHGPGAAH